MTLIQFDGHKESLYNKNMEEFKWLREKSFIKHSIKEQTVEKILAGEVTASLMAKEIGVHYSTVRDWLIAYEKDGSSAFPGCGKPRVPL